MAARKSPDDKVGDAVRPVSSAQQGQTLRTTEGRALDEAARYVATHDEFGPMTPAQEKEIVKKIDFHVVPLVSRAAPP